METKIAVMNIVIDSGGSIESVSNLIHDYGRSRSPNERRYKLHNPQAF